MLIFDQLEECWDASEQMVWHEHIVISSVQVLASSVIYLYDLAGCAGAAGAAEYAGAAGAAATGAGAAAAAGAAEAP